MMASLAVSKLKCHRTSLCSLFRFIFYFLLYFLLIQRQIQDCCNIQDGALCDNSYVAAVPPVIMFYKYFDVPRRMQKKITPQEMKFCRKDFVSKSIWSPQKTANLVTFTQEIFTGKLHFLCTHLFAQF